MILTLNDRPFGEVVGEDGGHFVASYHFVAKKYSISLMVFDKDEKGEKTFPSYPLAEAWLQAEAKRVWASRKLPHAKQKGKGTDRCFSQEK